MAVSRGSPPRREPSDPAPRRDSRRPAQVERVDHDQPRRAAAARADRGRKTMANHMKFLPRRAPPATDGSSVGKATGRLPAELVSEQVQRVGLFSAVIGALWTYGLLMDLVIVPLLLPSLAAMEIHDAGIPIELCAIAVSVAMFLYLRFSPHTPETKTTVGLGYMVANAVGIGLLNNWMAPPELSAPGIRLSWITNLILVFSIIAPTSPRRMFMASLVAATMDPLMAWLAHLSGRHTLTFVQTILIYMPNYTAALVATVPGKILRRISHRLRQAQELGSYQLIELLGQGGMGEVWRARHRLLARNAAIKIVRPEKLGAGSESDGKLILRRFEREAQATAA